MPTAVSSTSDGVPVVSVRMTCALTTLYGGRIVNTEKSASTQCMPRSLVARILYDTAWVPPPPPVPPPPLESPPPDSLEPLPPPPPPHAASARLAINRQAMWDVACE